MKNNLKKLLSLFLCVLMLANVIPLGVFDTFGLSIDLGSNPTPDVDIAVSVPADYAGDFDSFKEELTQSLIAMGMDPSSFRITDTAVKIDTTNLDGWYVYDHYYSQAAYDALNLSAAQKKKQPFRQADNSHMASQGGCPTPCLIQDVFVNKKYGNPTSSLYPFNQHTYSWQTDGKANMAFAGYGTEVKNDFMIYPATSDSRRTIEFDLDCAIIDAHTLNGAGFLLNAGVTDAGILNGYAFYYEWPSTARIMKITNYNTMGADNTLKMGGTDVSTHAVSLSGGVKLRVKVVLEKDKVTVTQRQYNGNVLGDETLLFDGVELDPTGYNGFGPYVGYKSHGCASMTYFQYGDLSMTYAATAFDALKNVQYAQSATQKYFVNLVGDSLDPNVPDEVDEPQNYIDGINRMDTNEIFYLSNADDGKILTDSNDETKHLGLGTENGMIASGSDYIEAMAQYIYNSYIEKKEFEHQKEIQSEIPLANFYITNADTGSQLMTVHLKHLGDSDIVNVNIHDKSLTGSQALGAGDTLTEWTLTVYDPEGTAIQTNTTTQTTTDEDGNVQPVLPDFSISKNIAKQGRYTFELVVKDNNNKKSETFQTYLTVFLDEEEPVAIAENSARNTATITLTDKGPGIADDGITFLEDDRGSGVAAYWLTDDPNASPTEEDWEYLAEPKHEYSFDVNLEDFAGKGKAMVVWYKDECGNIGSKLAYKPVHVEVQDPDGNPIDDYYVIGDNPIIVLPDEAPDPDDDDFEFSTWETPDGDPVTEGNNIPVNPDDDEPSIIIRPSYTDTKVKLIYDANAADATIDPNYTTFNVSQNSSLPGKIAAQKVAEKTARPGYNFVAWTLDAAGKQPITDQTIATDTTVYAQWEIASYTLTFDHNGGGAKGVKSKVVVFNTPLQTGVIDKLTGSDNPDREGYIFKGWTLDAAGTQAIGATTMPASDYTVYAKWEVDPTKYLVHFDSNGGSAINDQSYVTVDKNYKTLLSPNRAGYTFDGWFEKIVESDPETGAEKITIGDTQINTGDPILPKYATQTPLANREHTLIAKWTPKNDTRYNVAYYINSGVKNDQGEYIYTKVQAAGKSYQGTTEAEVTVADEDIIEVLEGSKYGLSQDYWYNAELAQNKLTGTVTGGTALELQLYYDRYFDVEVKIGKGEGTKTEALKNKEGTIPTVSWKAADDYHTSKVMVDDAMRDELIEKGQFTLDKAIHENHVVYVEFEKDDEDPTPTPPDPGPGIDLTKFYTISASIEGCYDGSCTITPNSRVPEGANATVEWNIADNYQIVEVMIDGIAVNKSIPNVAFTGTKADHEVIVKVVKLPSAGGTTEKGQYTVTVNRYGGDDSVTVSPSAVVDAGENVTVRWDASKSNTYKVFRVLVDGVELTSVSNINKANQTFRNIGANHVVDIYLTEKDNEEMPIYPEEDYNKLNTQIVGGPGTVTSGGLIASGSDYSVSWDINAVTDPTSEDYSYYEVEEITVNGEKKDDSAIADGKVDLTNLTTDTDVVIKIKPVLYNVDVLKFGNGTVSNSKTLYKGQSYDNIVGTPDAGWGIAKIVVDDETKFDITGVPDTASVAAYALTPEEINYTQSDKDKMDLGISGIESDHIVVVYFTEIPEGTDDPAPAPSEDDPDAPNIYKVTASINTAPNAVIEGQGLVVEGADRTVTWTVPDGYTLTSVTINGAPVEVTGNEIVLNGINADQNIQVNVEKEAKPNDEKVPVKEDNHDETYTVTTQLVGTGGTISGSGVYDSDVTSTVNWGVTPAENHNYEVKYVIVDGVVRADLLNAASIEFNDGQDHRVVVAIEDENRAPTNIDKDGDGEPDINIDTDGDGEPDVDIDTDDDGEPDINIDTDDDGEPDINIDTDGDGEPDVNIDTDDDGEPDINIDTDDDGKPDVDIDTDGDGKPDVNVDTDGDGEPDINIDTDDDGKPDINIDTDDDGKPDINIDTDDDGKPDINIDTD
ncbi:MAG: hypothetical protein HFE77_04570, partial [Clostridiales bacterium]|nr:hypothetical protein [Clostridiales bacterium]